MFLQFTPAYGFAFLQSGILPRAVFHKPPGRKTRCGKRTQTVVFHTGKSCCTRVASSPSQSPSVPALPKGEPLAVHANFISLPRPLPLGEVDANAVSRRRGRRPADIFSATTLLVNKKVVSQLQIKIFLNHLTAKEATAQFFVQRPPFCAKKGTL